MNYHDDALLNQSLKDFFASEPASPLEDLFFSIHDVFTILSYCLLLIHPKNQSILYHDASAHDLFQYTSSELSSLPFYQLHDSPWEKVSRQYQLSDHQKRKHFFTQFRKKDGSVFYAEIFLSTLLWKGEICYFILLKNLSEKKTKEEQLFQHQKRYKTLFANISFPLACLEVDWDEHKNIASCKLIECNRSFELMVALDGKSLINQPILEILPPFEQLPSPWTEYINKVLLDHEDVMFEVNIGVNQKNYLVTMSSLNETQFSVLFEDITSQKRLDKLRNAFINTLTHEIRSPLTAIKAGMEIWTKNPDSPLVKQENLPNMIQNNVNRLIHLINEVLDYQNIDNQTFQDFFTLQSINKLIQEIVENFQNSMEEKNIQLHLNLDDTIQKSWFYRDKISQVLIQLINNAFNSTNYGQITISTLLKRNIIQVSVSDTGVGIDQESQKKLFDTFFQINPSSRDDSGLGLAKSRKIIERHGGSIWVDSKPFQGSSFYFTIPYDILSKNSNGINKK